MESPSFNTHCSNNIADIANRVVQEFQVDKGFKDLISFTDDEINEADEENTQEDEFEFPLIVSGLNLSDNIIDNDQISPRYPLFDRSLLLDLDSTFISNLDSKSAPAPAPAPVPVPVPVSNVTPFTIFSSSLVSTPAPAISEDRDTQATRLPLGKLLSEARKSIESSPLILESNDLNAISSETYCVWKPQEKEHHQLPPKQHHSRGKHKKSNSISIGELVDTSSKRWKVRDLLKRSYSDDNNHTSCLATYSPPSKQKDGSSVGVLSPPISSKQNNEKVKKPEKAVKTTASMGVGCGGGTGCATSHKPENKSPAYKAKIGNIRLPAFLPYRQNQHQLDAFANNQYKWVK